MGFDIFRVNELGTPRFKKIYEFNRNLTSGYFLTPKRHQSQNRYVPEELLHGASFIGRIGSHPARYTVSLEKDSAKG